MKKGITLIAVLVGVLAVTSGAFAAGKHFLITSSSQIKNGVVSVSNLSPAARKALQGQKGDTGSAGPQGLTGAQGAKGDTGATGPQGPKGDPGATGAPGASGLQGSKGDKGDSWTPSYASASVWVQRGTGQAGPWATYSTMLGSPTGDTTGGAFRFTCKDTHVTCKLSIQASGPAGTTVYPRVLIYKQDFNVGGPSTSCEYADGATNNGNDEPVGTALTMGIGGSLDCPGSTQTYPSGGTATTIDVPAGYYDVWSTFSFKQS